MPCDLIQALITAGGVMAFVGATFVMINRLTARVAEQDRRIRELEHHGDFEARPVAPDIGRKDNLPATRVHRDR